MTERRLAADDLDTASTVMAIAAELPHRAAFLWAMMPRSQRDAARDRVLRVLGATYRGRSPTGCSRAIATDWQAYVGNEWGRDRWTGPPPGASARRAALWRLTAI